MSVLQLPPIDPYFNPSSHGFQKLVETEETPSNQSIEQTRGRLKPSNIVTNHLRGRSQVISIDGSFSELSSDNIAPLPDLHKVQSVDSPVCLGLSENLTLTCVGCIL